MQVIHAKTYALLESQLLLIRLTKLIIKMVILVDQFDFITDGLVSLVMLAAKLDYTGWFG